MVLIRLARWAWPGFRPGPGGAMLPAGKSRPPGTPGSLGGENSGYGAGMWNTRCITVPAPVAAKHRRKPYMTH